MRPVPAEKNISKDYSFKLKLRQFGSLAYEPFHWSEKKCFLN